MSAVDAAGLLDRQLAAQLPLALQRTLDGDRVMLPAQVGERWLDVTLVPEHGVHGVVGVFCLATEVTHLKRLQDQLFAEKEQAEVTLRSIGDAVVTTDVHTRIAYMNPIAEEMTGWPLEEARGRQFDEIVRLVQTDSSEPAYSPMRAAIRDDRTLGLAADTSVVRRDGLVSPIEDSAAPIHDRSGAVTGAVMVFHDVSESRAMALKMSHLAQHDYLTDLPNRVLLLDRMGQAITRAERSGALVALLIIDLDGFKSINESFGHETGDSLLREVAHRLTAAVPFNATVSRQGGDEFALMLADVREVREAVAIAELVLDTARVPIQVEGRELLLVLSIGVGLYPDDGLDVQTLMKHADAALREAKRAGGNRYQFFTSELSQRVSARIGIESRLRNALVVNDFLLYYQAKVDLEGRITGLEALLRWRGEDGRVIGPGEFIPVAEQMGLIANIDLWVLGEAARQCAAWRDQGLPVVPVAVNMSAASAHDQSFVAAVAAAIERHGLDPRLLEVELTESQLVGDFQRSLDVIEGLARLGVRVAIDDFGTGYSSLAYLVRFPFEILKIDRAFAHDLRRGSKQAAVVQAITQLAGTLGYRVVAEGVETPEQAQLARELGCDELQGYLFSRPAPPADAEAWLGAPLPFRSVTGGGG